MIVSTQVEPDNLVAHVQAIALTAQTALKSFEPKIQGGESKPEVWAMWPDFEKKMKDFAAGTAKLVEVAKTGGPNAVNEAMVDALTCKGCHDIYRTKK
jgi:cytochrome c556